MDWVKAIWVSLTSDSSISFSELVRNWVLSIGAGLTLLFAWKRINIADRAEKTARTKLQQERKEEFEGRLRTARAEFFRTDKAPLNREQIDGLLRQLKRLALNDWSFREDVLRICRDLLLMENLNPGSHQLALDIILYFGVFDRNSTHLSETLIVDSEKLVNLRFTENWKKLRFMNTKFHGAQFEEISEFENFVNSEFIVAQFRNCRFSRFSRSWKFKNCTFLNCQFDVADFQKVQLSDDCHFLRCKAPESVQFADSFSADITKRWVENIAIDNNLRQK